MRYCILEQGDQIQFVSIPDDYMNQFIALIHRLHKEIDKLTVAVPPSLPHVIGESHHIDWLGKSPVQDGLSYLIHLESDFIELEESNYPIIALLTEIRALKAQFEHLLEEGEYL
ncbi:MAG TPA: hydrolase/acyltransferase [Paenibacillaceae bacterium]|nr:hydrolase/acyltransferase [Paenibacillaceae bacterium]